MEADASVESWVARARAGEETAFRRLYDLHVERVHRLTWRICRDEELARDCTQECFIQAFRKLEEFRGDSRFSSWLHRIAVRAALGALRRTARHREGREALGEDTLPAAAPAALGFHLRDRVRGAVDALPEIYRTTLLLHDLEGWTHREIAELLEVEEGTSKARLSRARARLRAALGDELDELLEQVG